MVAECKIILTQGLVSIVDEEDYLAFSAFKWTANRAGIYIYAVRNSSRTVKPRRLLLLHREILGIKDRKIKVDHKDGDGLNNRRNNLRKATNTENAQNQFYKKDTLSGYKGVDWCYDKSKWRARIQIKGEQVLIGRYACKHTAALAYNEKATALFGQFANLNIVEDGASNAS